MCYAFSREIEEQLNLARKDANSICRHQFPHIRTYQQPTPPKTDGDNLSTKPVKRPAETTLEHENIKALKPSTDDNSIIDLDPSQKSSTESEEIYLAEEVKSLKLRIKNFEAETKELREENHDLRYDNAELQVKQGERDESLKAEYNKIRARGKLTTQKMNHDMKADMKRTYDQKLDVVKMAHKRKMQDVKAKHEDEIEGLNEKVSHFEKVAKDAKKSHAQAERDLKAEHQRSLKKAKSDFQEQLKQHKPEHSKAVKEMENLVKEKQKEITELRKARDNLEQDSQKLKDLSNRYEREKAKTQADRMEKDKHIEKLEEKLRIAGQRWQVENKKAERSTARIEELEIELKKAHDMCERLQASYGSSMGSPI